MKYSWRRRGLRINSQAKGLNLDGTLESPRPHGGTRHRRSNFPTAKARFENNLSGTKTKAYFLYTSFFVVHSWVIHNNRAGGRILPPTSLRRPQKYHARPCA